MKNKFPYFGLNKKVLALAPMDGYTDCAFRGIVKKYGKPDLIFTEFVNCQGLIRAFERLIEILRYSEGQRPIIAQVFGSDPEYFYKASQIICKLGFNGIDINMGCPARNIASKGGGASLIKSPDLAKEIIKSVKKGVEDYNNNKIADEIYSYEEGIKKMICSWKVNEDVNRKITISVKTRTGYAENIIERWVTDLNEAKPDFITIHGRTFKQGYQGCADWEAVARAVEISEVPIIGNGDIKSLEEAKLRLRESGCTGVMIGRGAVGKPWIFRKSKFENRKPEINSIALEHSELYVKYKGEQRFYELRKHLLKYFREFKGSKKLRIKLSQVNNLKELKEILDQDFS